MTLPPRTRPPFVGDERTQLVGWLDLQRAIVAWKCEGLSEEDAHRPLLPTSPLMTVVGLVAHLRWTEALWFEIVFLARPTDTPAYVERQQVVRRRLDLAAGDPDPEDLDFMVEDVPLAQLLAEYGTQCATSNEIIGAHSLDDVGRHPDFGAARASLRWMLLHMVEETARHIGHLDTLREQLDGAKGYY